MSAGKERACRDGDITHQPCLRRSSLSSRTRTYFEVLQNRPLCDLNVQIGWRRVAEQMEITPFARVLAHEAEEQRGFKLVVGRTDALGRRAGRSHRVGHVAEEKSCPTDRLDVASCCNLHGSVKSTAVPV